MIQSIETKTREITFFSVKLEFKVVKLLSIAKIINRSRKRKKSEILKKKCPIRYAINGGLQAVTLGAEVKLLGTVYIWETGC